MPGNREADWIDISVTVAHRMPHWPGNPPVILGRFMDLEQGDECTLSHLAMGVHSGTHVDGPVHFLRGAPGVDAMPLSATVGRARVVEIRDPRQITAEELRGHRLQAGERVLFRTANSHHCWQSTSFVDEFVYVSEEGAKYLADTRVRTVGVDYLSVGGYHADGVTIHRILMTAGIWIIEGLDLSAAPAGEYEMICLPVKLRGTDGAPARAILRPFTADGAAEAGGMRITGG